MSNSRAFDEFEPLQLVEEITREQLGRAREKGIELSSFCQPSLTRVIRGNRKLIKTSLSAIAEYAIENTSFGAVVIEALLDTAKGSEWMRWAVSETAGAALRPSEIENIADNFICPDGSICRACLTELHTSLEGESLHGSGARFYFRQKLLRAEGATLEQRFPPYLNDLRVFVVSNEPPQNRAVQNYLRYAGAFLNGAPTANEAMIALAKATATGQAYDVVIVVTPIEDLSPQLIVKQILESQITRPKLLFIGPDEETCRQQCYSQGFDRAICKPLSQQLLYDTMAKLIGRGQLYEHRNNKPLVLIVEDNLINQKILLFQLRALGYEAETVSNGREAVEAASNTSYAAILMDLQMPELDGIQATTIIRTKERDRGHVPIIAVTANENWKADALKAGVDDLLAKPVSIDTLRNVMQRYVQNQRWVS